MGALSHFQELSKICSFVITSDILNYVIEFVLLLLTSDLSSHFLSSLSPPPLLELKCKPPFSVWVTFKTSYT